MAGLNSNCESSESSSPPYLRVKEAAVLVGITEGTLRNKIADGSFNKNHGLRRFYGRCLIDRAILLAALNAGAFERKGR